MGAGLVPVRQHGEGRRFRELVVPLEAETSPVFARSLGIRDEAVADDANGVVRLRLLDGRVLGVLTVCLDSVRAVRPGPCAITTCESFQEAVVLGGRAVDLS